MARSPIAQLRETLRSDLSSTHARFPEQALIALADKRVSDTVSKYLDEGKTLVGIHNLGYSFFSGLIHIYFDFVSAGIALGSESLLVILDDSRKVVGLKENFDPNQPNRHLPPLPERGEQPFVLARPTSSRVLTFTEGDLFPREVASVEFFKKLNVQMPSHNPRRDKPTLDDGGEGGGGEGGGGEGGGGEGGGGEGGGGEGGGGEGGGGEGGGGEGGGGGPPASGFTNSPYSTSYSTLYYVDTDGRKYYEADGRVDSVVDD